MKRILIVEDDRAIAELERDYLEANDYEVEICEDGESGLKRALQEDFALILLDVMLPKEDGFQVCRGSPTFTSRISAPPATSSIAIARISSMRCSSKAAFIRLFPVGFIRSPITCTSCI